MTKLEELKAAYEAALGSCMVYSLIEFKEVGHVDRDEAGRLLS